MKYKKWGASIISDLVTFIRLITFSVMGLMTFVFISSVSLSLMVAVLFISLLNKIKVAINRPQKKQQPKLLTLDEDKT
ncbi:hypothetical protein GCM10007916_08020 [Psychromonas marina]|uniref:Uncharacterized protein n=1 Tax=Psychromonas marina TaxID=88364 RepID=A0ABQ6DXM7_9GAMM|nr:hypothetical protein [Psychromonas marina]GLS89735.1 hypothetical protein GCM10007916_08020 [Psychromonas marina]